MNHYAIRIHLKDPNLYIYIIIQHLLVTYTIESPHPRFTILLFSSVELYKLTQMFINRSFFEITEFDYTTINGIHYVSVYTINFDNIFYTFIYTTHVTFAGIGPCEVLVFLKNNIISYYI